MFSVTDCPDPAAAAASYLNHRVVGSNACRESSPTPKPLRSAPSNLFSDLAAWPAREEQLTRRHARRPIAPNPNGLRVKEANEPADVQQFAELYLLNMQRLQARDWYMFPETWLSELHARFLEHLTLFFVYEGQRLVAGGSVFHMNGLVGNFLSATAEDCGQFSPNNLLFYEIIRWAKRRGYRWYNMGGGYRNNDGVMRFKLNFSQHTEDFHTYQKVHLPQAYEALVQEWRQALSATIEMEDSKYFPLYRMSRQ
ncbi:MAG: GNAT family N-acetyltransferase [Nitrospira sp. CG24E]|nr:MAG: GNAT family N-acetyltransferase [Nitrospira sp. CG24E]